MEISAHPSQFSAILLLAEYEKFEAYLVQGVVAQEGIYQLQLRMDGCRYV